MRLNYRVLLFTLIMTGGIVTAGFAQQRASISGYVTDASSGETLLMASVAVQGTTTGAMTNNSGYYILTGLEPGTYTLVATFIGYAASSVEVTLAPGESVRLNFALQPEGVELDEVVVSSDRSEEEERTQIGVSRLAMQTITQVPAVFEADVFRSLQLLPGIKSASDFSSGLYIRGGGPDQTMILLDRTVVYNPTHVFGFFSTFNPDALKDVQVYKGGYPAEYGGRLGSVIDIYNKDGNRQQVEGKVSLGLLASRASIEGPYKKGSYMLAVRRSTMEPVLAALRQSNDGIPNTFYFYDVNGKLNFDAGRNDRISLAVYGGTDNMGVVPSTDIDVRLLYGNRTGSLNWTHLFSDRLFSNFTFTGSRYFSLPEIALAKTAFDLRNEVFDFSAKGDIEFVPSQRHTLEAGFWGGMLTLKYRERFDGVEQFSSRIQSRYGYAYVQETWRPTHRWMVQGGLRAAMFTEGDYIRFEPRLSVERRQSERLRVQAAYGRYYQFLTLITNEAFSALDTWLTAADGVRPSWGDQFVLGLKTIPRAGYRLDAEVYYRTMEDLFELDPYIGNAAGLDYAEMFRIGDGYAYGTEWTLEKSRGRLNGFIGYTYGNTRRRFPGYNEGRFYPPKYDRTHDVNVVANYDLSRRWRATATFAYATGQAYTRALGRTQYEDPFSSVPADEIINGKVNASRLPAYHRLDLGVTRLGRLFGLADTELQIQLINVYNRRNTWFYQFDFDENPAKMETVQMLPILPNFSYTVKF